MQNFDVEVEVLVKRTYRVQAAGFSSAENAAEELAREDFKEDEFEIMNTIAYIDDKEHHV